MTLRVTLRHRLPGLALEMDFAAPAGVTALFGRSGAGKTTIVNAVAGLLRPDAGRIEIAGEVLTDTAAGIFVPPHRRRIGYVFQDARLFPHLSVRANLGYGRRGNTGPDLARIVGLLGLGHLLDRRPRHLSGGEKSRVALGRAALSDPRILLLDEPLAALDEARRGEILPWLERLRDDTGLPMLYVSHSLAEVARLATTVVAVEAGRVVAAGPAAEVLSDPDLAPALGLREAGAILTARATGREEDGLSLLDTPAGPLWLPRVAAPPGTALRLRILARDVIVATRRPEGISALNLLPAVVRDIRPGEGPGAMVRLDAGGAVLLARITRRSAAALALAPGSAVFAVLKAVSVAQGDIGGAGPGSGG